MAYSVEVSVGPLGWDVFKCYVLEIIYIIIVSYCMVFDFFGRLWFNSSLTISWQFTLSCKIIIRVKLILLFYFTQEFFMIIISCIMLTLSKKISIITLGIELGPMIRFDLCWSILLIMTDSFQILSCHHKASLIIAGFKLRSRLSLIMIAWRLYSIFINRVIWLEHRPVLGT